MVTTLPKPKQATKAPEPMPARRQDRPWHAYRALANWKLLEPGWTGQLDDDELAFVQEKLRNDDALSAWWGFRPGAKRRAVEAIRRVARDGDPDNQTFNRGLARMKPERAFPGLQSPE